MLCPSPDPLDKGLELEWGFNQDKGLIVPDHSGYERHIKPSTALTVSQWVSTRYGPGLQVPNDGSIPITNITIEDLGIPDVWTAITLESCVGWDSYSGSWPFTGPLSFPQSDFEDSTYSAGYSIRGDGGLGAYGELVAGGNHVVTALSPLSSIAVGSYVHLVMTYDGQALRIYRNGQYESEGALSGTIDDSIYGGEDEFQLNSAAGGYSHGLTIFNNRVYNRALTGAEIRKRYHIVQMRMRPTIVLSNQVALSVTEVGLPSYRATARGILRGTARGVM
jgi:hypothetical protein